LSKPEYIRIIKPGILSSIQDAGRSGFRSVGIGQGGVMDSYAFNVANYLLGNEENSPVIEMHFPAPVVEFQADCFACLTGGNFSAKLNEKVIDPWKPFPVNNGDILSFEKIKGGFRSYLAVSGGFEGDEWLGSYSTHLILKMGGVKGRALQRDDLIKIRTFDRGIENGKLKIIEKSEISSIYDFTEPILSIRGPEFDILDEQSKNALFTADFRISEKSNRMACLLHSSIPLKTLPGKEMLSSAVLMGTVQLLPSGSLAILMADHQTTGGFPRILQILKSQLPTLAQHQPGERIGFRLTDQKSAEENYLLFMKKHRHGEE
jgi:antagonist of KipI